MTNFSFSLTAEVQIKNNGSGGSLVWGHLKYVYAKSNLVCEACVVEEGNVT